MSFARIGRLILATGAVTAVVSAGIGTPAHAAKVSTKGNSPDRVQGKCGESGGTYSPPNKNGVYGCLNPDGSGIVCGGVTKTQKKTCDTFRVAPGRFPTMNELENRAPLVDGRLFQNVPNLQPVTPNP